MKIEKKGEKSREAIMIHNENERRAIVDEQIVKFKEDLKAHFSSQYLFIQSILFVRI